MSDDQRERHARRRSRVLHALGDDGVMIVPAAPELRVGRDLELRYVPDAELFYLTGYTDPGAVAALRPGHDDGPFTLFVRDRDPDAERWSGARADPDADRDAYAADAAYPLSELEERLPDIVGDAERIFFRLGAGRERVETLVREILMGGRKRRAKTGRGPTTLVDPGVILDDMRLIKEPYEIEQVRRAAQITTDAVRGALDHVAPGTGEWEIEARIDAAFRSAGADGPAFATIVASGANATVLHYIANDRTMGAGDALLVDAGARIGGYNADISRTVPVGERFSAPQQTLYDGVLAAHAAATTAIRPGATFQDVHHAAVRCLVETMVEHGLLDGEPEDLADDEDAYKPYFPHRAAHWLGLDVHDVGRYAIDGEPRTLEPGMILTVEPGIYVPADAEDAPEHFRGIGIRIEDDVLVTPTGHETLTADFEPSP